MEPGARPAPLQGELLTQSAPGPAPRGAGGRKTGPVDRRRGTAERVAVPLAGLALFASLAFTVHPWFDGRADAALYVATARSLAAGEGYSYLGSPFTLRPPGLSLLLCPLVAWRGVDFHAFHLVVSAFGALAVVCFFLWLRPRLGWVLALLAAASVWLNPGFQRHSNMVMSDVPALALILLCFVLERRAVRGSSWRRELLLGLVVGLACYFRTAAVLLMPSILLARLLEPRQAGEGPVVRSALRRSAVSLGVASAVALSWTAYSAAATSLGPADQTRLHSYMTVMLREDSGDPESRALEVREILERPARRAPRIFNILGRRLGQGQARSDGTVQVLVNGAWAAALLAALAVQLVRRRGVGEIFAALTLLSLLVYVGLAIRLVLPVYVVAFGCLVELLRELSVRGLGGRWGVALVAAALAALTWVDVSPREGWEGLEAGHRRRERYFSLLAAALPADARLATFKAFQYNVYLDQPTYSLRHAVRRNGAERGLDLIVERYGIDTVVLFPEIGPMADNVEAVLRRRLGPPQRVGVTQVWDLRAGPRGGR